jgi:hypothetical protein
MRVVEIVQTAEVQESAADVAAAMLSEDFVPWERIVVEGTPASGGAGNDASQLPTIASQEIRPDGLEISLAAGDDAWLHASYNFLPGFTCRVDGSPVPIWRAHLAFMAVRLPAGARRVSFVYKPPGLLAGRSLTILGLSVFVLLTVSSLRQQRLPSRS